MHTREVFGLLAMVLSGEHTGKEPSSSMVNSVVQVGACVHLCVHV